MSEEPDKLDSVLDVALREYSKAEPRAGFEQRILRRIQTTPDVRRSRWRFGWALIPVALGLLLRVGMPTRDIPAMVLLPPLPPAVAEVVMPKSPKPDAKPRIAAAAEPPPLTVEERELLRFVRDYPEQAREVLTLSAQIEAIEIEPLEIEALQ